MRSARAVPTMILAAAFLGAGCGQRDDAGGADELPPAVEEAPPGVVESPGDTAPPLAEPAPADAPSAPGEPPPAAPGGAAVPSNPAQAPQAPAAALRGRVGVSGTAQEPITVIDVEGRGALIVQGRHEADLRTLSGAVVAVRGTEAGTRRRTIDVTAYEILEIDGQRPVVGTILPDGRLAAGSETFNLVGASSELRPGDRAWVVGERSGTTLRVSSAGRIGTR